MLNEWYRSSSPAFWVSFLRSNLTLKLHRKPSTGLRQRILRHHPTPCLPSAGQEMKWGERIKRKCLAELATAEKFFREEWKYDPNEARPRQTKTGSEQTCPRSFKSPAGLLKELWPPASCSFTLGLSTALFREEWSHSNPYTHKTWIAWTLGADRGLRAHVFWGWI